MNVFALPVAGWTTVSVAGSAPTRALGDRHGAADRRHPRVVEALAVGRPRRARVLRAGDDVGQVLAGRDLVDARRRLVGVVLLDRVRDVLAVVARPPATQALGAVLAPAVRIEQHPLRAALALLPVDDRLLLVGVLARVEEAALAVHGRADRVVVEQLAQPRGDHVTPRQLRELAAGEVVLLLHPRLDLGSLLVLEPAIRVGDRDTVNRVDDRVLARLRPGMVRHGVLRWRNVRLRREGWIRDIDGQRLRARRAATTRGEEAARTHDGEGGGETYARGETMKTRMHAPGCSIEARRAHALAGAFSLRGACEKHRD
jgi:hypothetical protein